jgi:hypothetical protein
MEMEPDMTVEMRSPAATEKRESDRIRSFLRAQIIFNNRMTTIDCIVKNISSTGARVALDNTLAVPTEFDIYIPQRGRSHHARLIWRDKDSIGIDFIDAPSQAATQSHNAAASSPPEMAGASVETRLQELEEQNAALKRRIRALTQKLEDLGQDPDNIV